MSAAIKLKDSQIRDLLRKYRIAKLREQRRKAWTYFPETGPLRRELYKKHMEFFEAGATYRERCFMAGNRTGKTISGAFESVLHLTGLYDDIAPWWCGRRFTEPVRGWASGKTNETTRDILQAKLFGEIAYSNGRKTVTGTGLIPGDLIGDITWKQGVSDFIDTAKIKHVTGGWSTLGLKSYQQGRGSFEGTEQHFVWLDEEAPLSIYGECLIRTATTNGLVMLTFTPLEGCTETVLQFLPEGVIYE